MKKFLVVLGILLVAGSMMAEIHSWNSGFVKFKVSERFSLGGNGELRLQGSDYYYGHFHFDLNYALNKYMMVGVSERESYLISKEQVEHKPMFNVTLHNSWLSNRARVTWRIKEGEDVLRFRNKTTVTIKPVYAAYELFVEGGKEGIYRNRMYLGASIAPALSVFVMRQTTLGESIWVVGTVWKVSL